VSDRRPSSLVLIAPLLAACAASPTGAPAPAPVAPAPAPTSSAPVATAAATAAADGCAAPDVPGELAAAVEVTDVIAGCLEPGGGADVYRVTVGGAGPQRLRFAITGAGDGLTTNVELLAADGRSLLGGRATDRDRTLMLVADPGAIAHVRVAANVDPRAPRPYRIAITAEALPDPGEPNDKAALASPLTPGQPLAAALTPRLTTAGLDGDVDHYVIVVPAAGTLTVALDEVDRKLSPAMAILDEQGKVVIRQGPSGLGAPLTTSTRVAPGRYVARVGHGHYVGPIAAAPGAATVGYPYRITATVR